MQKFKETGDSQNIYQKELDIACFQHDMGNGDFKDLSRRAASDKILRDKTFTLKSTITFYRQYLGCWPCWSAISKQIS